MKTKILAFVACFFCASVVSFAQDNKPATEKKEETQRSGQQMQRRDRTFPSEKMIKDLSLKEDQVKKLKTLSTDMEKKTKEVREKYKDDRKALGEKMKALNDEREKGINKVLNDDQKKIWEKQKKEREEQMKKMRENRGNRGERGERGQEQRPAAPTQQRGK